LWHLAKYLESLANFRFQPAISKTRGGGVLQKLAWKMRGQSRMRLLSSHCVQLSAPMRGYCPEDVHILNVVGCVKRLILIYFAIQIPKK
jgi:hypothetical protein